MTYKSNDLYQLLNLACYKHTGRFLPADEEQENRWKYIITDGKKLAVQPSPTANWFRPSFFNDLSLQVNRRIITDSIKQLHLIPRHDKFILPELGERVRNKWKDIRVYECKQGVCLPKCSSEWFEVRDLRDRIAKIYANLSCDYEDIGLTETDREFMADIMKLYKQTHPKFKYGFLTKKDSKLYNKFYKKYDDITKEIITWEEFRKIPASARDIRNDTSSRHGGLEYISSGEIDKRIKEKKYDKCAKELFGLSGYNPQSQMKQIFITKSGGLRKRPKDLLCDWFWKVFMYNLPYDTAITGSCGVYADLPAEDPSNNRWKPSTAGSFNSAIKEIAGRTLDWHSILRDNPERRRNGWEYAKAKSGRFTMAELMSMMVKPNNRYETLIRRLSRQ